MLLGLRAVHEAPKLHGAALNGGLRKSYLLARAVTLQSIINETSVDDRDKCVALDMSREGQFPVRLLDVPFFLEFGGCLSVICEIWG